MRTHSCHPMFHEEGKIVWYFKFYSFSQRLKQLSSFPDTRAPPTSVSVILMLCDLIASVCFHVNVSPLKHESSVSTRGDKACLTGSLHVCECVCVSVSNSVNGPIISHVVYCHAAQTDALQCVSFQALAVFVPTVITTHTHTHGKFVICLDRAQQQSNLLLVMSVCTL